MTYTNCNFWGKVKPQKMNSPCQQRKWHTEPSRIRLDSSAAGDINLWLKQIPQPDLGLAAGEGRGARERGAALPHPLLLGVGMGHVWSTPLPVGKFLAFLAENDMPLVRSNQPWKRVFAMTPISPVNDIPAASSFFGCRVDTSSDLSLAQLKRKQKRYSGPRSNVGG